MASFMKKCVFFTLTLVLLMTVTVSAETKNKKTVYFNFRSDYEPYQVDDNGRYTGFEVQLVERIFRDSDYKVEIIRKDLTEMTEEEKNNQVIFLTGAKNSNGFSAVDFLYTRKFSAFSLEENQYKMMNFEKFIDMKVGTLYNCYAVNQLKEHGISPVIFSTPYQGIQALKNGEIDVWYGDSVCSGQIISDNNWNDIIHFHDEFVETSSVYLAASNDNRELCAYVKSVLKEVTESGEFENLFIQYFMKHSDVYIQRQTITAVAVNVIIVLLVILLLVMLFYSSFKAKFLKLKFSKSISSSILNYGNRFVILWKNDGSYYETNDYFKDTFGLETTQQDGKLPKLFKDEANFLNSDNFDASSDHLIKIPDVNGTLREILWTSIAIEVKKNNKGVKTWVSIGSDMTEKNQLKRQLRVSEERWQIAMDSTEIALIFFDKSGNITQMSEIGYKYFGLKPDEEVDYDVLTNRLHPSDRESFLKAFRSCIQDDTVSVACEVRVFCQNDRYKWFQFKFKSVYNEVDSEHSVAGAFFDIDADKNKDIIIEKLAFEDDLTGIYNRHKFLRIVNETLDKNKGTDSRFAVVTLNLDKFHRFNDLYGVETGDKILRAVASILKYNPYGVNCSCSRLGNDEFAMLISLGSDSDEHIEQYIMDICKKIRNYTSWEYDEMKLTISAGGCIYPDNASDYKELYERAIYSMRIAKSDSSIIYQAYNSSIRDMIIKKEILEKEVQVAVEKKQFELYYQPKIDIATEKIVGAEALIRWHHPTKGIVSPMEFIPIAEQMGIIGEIGKWTLETACAQNKTWQEEGYSPIKVSVNLSSTEFYQTNIVDQIQEILAKTGLDPKWLEIELTESMALVDLDEAIFKMTKLRELGVGISMDDFGTGYSSLSYIKDLPIDELKLDKTFIDSISVDATSKNIISAIINLAKIIGLVVVAEGVEERIQFELLKEMRCNLVQGYLFGRPLQADVIVKMMEP